MRKNYVKYLLLIGIVFLGTILRLKGLNKPFGLGYDEAIAYVMASKNFPFEIITGLVRADVHMPLYFLMLHLWMKLFTNSDIAIRLLSVLFGVLTIFFGYLSGKEIKNEKTGLISALIFSINSLAIYYSQEARFYSLLIMLSTVVLLFFIKAIKTPVKRNFLTLIFSSFLLIYTNTLSCIFIIIIFLELLLFLYLYHKDKIKIFLLCILIGQIFLLPFYWLIYQISIYHGTSFFTVFFFDNQVIFSIIQNWFSPVLIGLNNNPLNYFTIFIKNISAPAAIFILIPVIINLVFIMKNDFKKSINVLIASTVLIFISIELLASYFNRFTILSRYTLFVLPFLIVLAANGLNNFKNKLIARLLFVTLILTNIFYLIVSPISAPKLSRLSGQKIPANILQEYKISKHDIVIYPLRDNLSDKYYQNDFSKFKMLQIFSELYPQYNPQADRYSHCKPVFESDDLSIFENFFNREFYNKMDKTSRLVILIQKDFMPYDPRLFDYILSNDVLYRKQPLLFMKMSKIANDAIIISNTKLNLEKVYNIENWVIVIYKKRF